MRKIKDHMLLLTVVLSGMFFLANADAANYTSKDDFNADLDSQLVMDPNLNKQIQGWDDPALTGMDVGGLTGTIIDDVTYQNLTVGLIGLPSFKRLFILGYDSFDPSPTPVSDPNALSRTGVLALTDTLTLTFENRTMAFGISMIPMVTETSWSVELFGYDNEMIDGLTSTFNPDSGDPDNNMGTEFFVGFISDTPVKTVMMTVTTPTVYVYDDMVYASEVPVPGAAMLLFSGIIGILSLKRKKA